jgi:hypothetical protein
VRAIFSVLYLAGLVGTLVNPSRLLDELGRELPPVRGLVAQALLPVARACGRATPASSTRTLACVFLNSFLNSCEAQPEWLCYLPAQPGVAELRAVLYAIGTGFLRLALPAPT